jgi:hypothetical protein
MRIELAKSQGASAFPVVTIALPGGTRRYALGPGVAAAGVGQFEGLLLELGSLSRSFDFRASTLQDVEFDLLLADPDDSFAALVEGAAARSIRGSAVTRQLGSLNVPPADWHTTFAGVVDRYALDGPQRWRISVRPDDLALRRSFPRASIDFADWPSATEDALAQYGPLIYGKHDSIGNTNKGAVPCLSVDPANYRYLVAWGWLKSVDRVYADGANLPTGWSVTHPVLNSGRIATALKFTTNQGSKAITADVQGYESVGDGTGTLLDNGADQIQHLLSNFVFGDYRAGAWLSTSALIDATSWETVRAYLQTYGGGSSRRIFGDQRKGVDVLNEWAASTDVKLFWTAGGELGAAIVDPGARDIYSDTAWLRNDDGVGGRFAAKWSPDWESLVDRIDVQFLYGEAAGKYLRSVTVADPSLGYEAGDSLQLPWSAAYL